MPRKLFYFITIIVFIFPRDIFCMTLKYEPPFSYGIVGSVDIFAHPQTPDAFVQENIGSTKTQRFVPGAGLFVEYRLFNSVGVILLGNYTNRSFAHDTDFLHTKVITDLYCIDASIAISILPKGYGGVSIYAGPKLYFLLGSSCASYTYKGEKKDLGSVTADFEKRNIGGLLGIKIEIDRTGIILGTELEYFLNPMKPVLSMPEIYKQNGYSKEKEDWQKAQNLNRFSAFGWKFQIGYDFGRLHTGY